MDPSPPERLPANQTQDESKPEGYRPSIEMIVCRECGFETPLHAWKCRICGTSIPEQVLARYRIAVAVLVGVVLLFTMVYLLKISRG